MPLSQVEGDAQSSTIRSGSLSEMEQRWEDSNKASNGKESVAKIGREGYLAKSCRTAMSCKLLEKKYFAKFLRFAKIFQTCLAKPS